MSSTDTAPLSVAIIRARYNPHGGAERFVQRALAALSGRALTLTIVARDWQHGGPVAGDARGGGAPVPSAGEGLPAGVAFVRVDPFYIGNVWRDRSFARAVQRHLAGARYQLVQSHERIPGVMLYRAGDGVHAEFLAQRERVLTPLQRLGLRLNPYHRYTLRAERRMFEHPALRAVVLDLPVVWEVARDFIAENGVADRVEALACNFTRDAFPADCDVAVMASNLPMYGREMIATVIAKAHDALLPGGQMHLIGEMTNDQRSGPWGPAYWGLGQAISDSLGLAHSEADVLGYVRDAGFQDVALHDFIAGSLGRVTGTKAA